MRVRPVLLAAALLAGAAACTREGAGDQEAFCGTADELADDGGLAAELGALDLDDQAGSGDALRTTATRLRSWAESANGEVADDIEVLADASDAIAEAVAGGGSATITAEARAELEAVVADAGPASERVVSQVAEFCGVQLGPGPAAPAAATTSTTASG